MVLAETEADAVWVAIEVVVEEVEAFEHVRDPGTDYREFALPAEFTNHLRAARFEPAYEAPETPVPSADAATDPVVASPQPAESASINKQDVVDVIEMVAHYVEDLKRAPLALRTRQVLGTRLPGQGRLIQHAALALA